MVNQFVSKLHYNKYIFDKFDHTCTYTSAGLILNLAGYDYEKRRDFHSYLARNTFRWHTYPLTSDFFPHFIPYAYIV